MELLSYKTTESAPAAGAAGLPLGGKRIVIQPNMSVRGWPCDAGSRALENFIALEDATVVSRLVEAGAFLVGSSRMSELGFGLAGDTTVQVVQKGAADIALITDTMGEARTAAAEAGLFGFKPSWGIVSRAGLIGLVPSMESWGIAARDLKDIVSVMAAVTGRDDRDFSMPDEDIPDFTADAGDGLRNAAVVKEMLSLLTDAERRDFQTGLAEIERAGVRVREVSLPEFDLFRCVHQVIAGTEASSSAGKYDGVRYGHRSSESRNWNEMYLNSRGESFGPLVKAFLFQGAYFQFENYEAFENACRIRRRLVRAVTGLFEEIDLIVSPTRRLPEKSAGPADIDGIYDSFLMTLPANVTGQPAVQAPLGTAMGVQLAAGRLDDARLLALAGRIAAAQEVSV
jgi:aspartyl-tRNA(Asn)/glutamyl-tRNA(Gln) amidotransferase subunit A